MILNTIPVMSFLTFLLLFYALLRLIFRNKIVMGRRLRAISRQNSKNEEGELSQPLYIRLIKPVFDSITRAVMKITPKEIVEGFEKKVIKAGGPFGLTSGHWINLQALAAVFLPLTTTVALYFRRSKPGVILLLDAAEIALAVMLPHIILNSQAAERQKRITNSLPDVIDLLTVSVEAGLGFDGALARVTDKMPGPLAVEFDRVLQETKVGKQKKEALKDMAERVDVPDLTTFVGSIVQAEQFGIGIGNVLRVQSEQMRQKRRQRAQEKAMKAPVKMLIPMILFIFPTIFSVLIGPIILRVIEALKK